MILETQIEEKKEELDSLREDVDTLGVEIEEALASAEDTALVEELRAKKKTLMAYIQDLVEELAGMQIGFTHVGGPDGEDTSAAYQERSFGHALVHSTIIEDETGTSEESGEGDSLSPEGGPGWDRSPEIDDGESVPQTEDNIEDSEGAE